MVKLSPDQIAGSRTTAKLLVDAYNLAPDDPAASQGLGLLALMVGVTEWGISDSGLPCDPAGKDWASGTGEDSGKHLMSYAEHAVVVGEARRLAQAHAAQRRGNGVTPEDRMASATSVNMLAQVGRVA